MTDRYAAGQLAMRARAQRAAGEAAHRHEGHDGYSREMDRAAVAQVRACVDAIGALEVEAGEVRPSGEDGLIEAVADALWSHENEGGGPMDDGTPMQEAPQWQADVFRARARTAIAAVRASGVLTVRLSMSAETAGVLARRQALEEAARACEAAAEDVRAANTFRDRVDQVGVFGSSVADDCAKRIRALIAAPPARAAP